MITFVVDASCGRGHVMRCASIAHDLALIGYPSRTLTGFAQTDDYAALSERIQSASVIALDHYGNEWPSIAHEWAQAGKQVVVLDDFGTVADTWVRAKSTSLGPVAIHPIKPIGDYAIVRQAVRRLKGTPKRRDLLRLRPPTAVEPTFTGEALRVNAVRDRLRDQWEEEQGPGPRAGSFEESLAIARKVRCYAGLTAIEAAYLDCELDLEVQVENQRQTYDWLMSGGRPDGLGSVRIARRLVELAGHVKPVTPEYRFTGTFIADEADALRRQVTPYVWPWPVAETRVICARDCGCLSPPSSAHPSTWLCMNVCGRCSSYTGAKERK